MFSECFKVFFSIVGRLGREPDFWAENRIFKNFLKSLKTCLVGVFWVFQGILAEFEICAENHIFEPRTGFSKIYILKKPQSMFCWCFLGVSMYFFSIVRHLSREQDFWAENQISKKFLKSLKTCLVGVFWVFHVFFSIVRHLSREPDFWAENSVFKTFLKACKHV